LKEANQKLMSDLTESTRKQQKKALKLSELRQLSEANDEESRADKAALQQSRDLVL